MFVKFLLIYCFCVNFYSIYPVVFHSFSFSSTFQNYLFNTLTLKSET
jgi:hypothetical protein